MRSNYFSPTDAVELQDVLAALNDHQCRDIIEALNEEPKTASELADELAIPLSSLYRKLNTLAEVSLLETTIDIRRSGKHVTRYSVAFDTVTVDFNEGEFGMEIARPTPLAG